MKKFLLNVLSSAAGVFLAASIVVIVFTVLLISAAASMGVQSPANVEPHSVLRIDLEGVLSERSQDSPLTSFGMDVPAANLEEIISSIKVAKANSNIDGIYINAGAVSANPASLQEIRRALTDFRKSGKFVVSYAGTYTQGAYYVCSAASKIILNPIGELEWRGMG